MRRNRLHTLVLASSAAVAALLAPSAFAGVTLTTTADLPTAWPTSPDGTTPLQQTTANPNNGTVNQTWSITGGAPVGALTFTAGTNFTLGSLAFVGTGGSVGFSLHLYPFNPSSFSPGGSPNSPTYIPQTSFSGPDMLGGGNGVIVDFFGTGGNRVINLDFTDSDQVALTAGTTYALEFWIRPTLTDGTTASQTLFVSRAGQLGNDNSINQVANGADPVAAQSASSTVIRGLVGGGPRSAIMAIYTNVVGGPKSLVWNGASGATWDHSTQNFINNLGSVPAAFTDGDTVAFGDATSGTVNLSGVLKPGTLDISSSNAYELAGSGSLAGSGPIAKTGAGNLVISTSNSFTGAVTVGGGTLTLNNVSALGASPIINVANGAILASNVTTSIPSLNLGVSGGQVSVASGKTLTVTGPVTGNSLLKLGTGNLTLAGNLTYVQNTTVSNGNLNINSPLRTSPQLIVAGAGHAVLAAPPTAIAGTGYTVAGEFTAGIFVDSDLTATVAAVNRSTQKPSVVITSTVSDLSGLLDITNNDLIVHTVSTDDVRNAVKNWYNNGDKNGSSGIGSTVTTALTTLAVFPNAATDGSAYYASYDGIALTSSDVIVKYTYVGDTNIDGVVNGLDLANAIEALSVGGLTGWQNGDVNYDGVVDVTDINLIKATITANPGSLGNGQGGGSDSGSVPEPTALAAVLLAAPLMSRRRR